MIRNQVKLKEVANVSAGNPAPQDQSMFINGKYPFVRTSDVGAVKVGELNNSRDFLNEKGINKLKIFPKGSILFPKSGASTFLNHRVILQMDAYVVSHLAVIKANNEHLLDRYLFYFLQTIDAAALVAESAYPSLQIKSILEIDIPIPSLNEQKIIIAKLDKGFEKIQNIKTQITEKSKLIIAIKESIISQYTNNDNNKTKLFWKRSPLSDLCKKYKDDIVDGPFGSNLKTKDFKDEGVPVLKIQHVKQFEINYLKPTYISNQKYNELIRHSFKKGDIVLTKLGKPLGAASIVQEINEGIIVADLVRIRIDPQKIDNEFLCFQLNSLHIRAEINSFTRGATRPRIKLDVIRTLKINYPHIQEQKNISKKLNKLLNEVSKLIKTNEEIGNQLELLKLSMLRNLLIKK